jgi:hypothetical protein
MQEKEKELVDPVIQLSSLGSTIGPRSTKDERSLPSNQNPFITFSEQEENLKSVVLLEVRILGIPSQNSEKRWFTVSLMIDSSSKGTTSFFLVDLADETYWLDGS